jgi:predicted protein tyrosine phosphatase
MTILVCPLSRVADMVACHLPGRVVSLLDPGSNFPELGPRYADRHLRLSFHDINVPSEGMVTASVGQLTQLVDFVAAWERREPILFHCRAGISRSTAAAFIAACWCSPARDEHEIAVTLRRVAPLARPNLRLIGLADDLLERGGRMSAAIATTGRELQWAEVEEAEPFGLPLNGGSGAR